MTVVEAVETELKAYGEYAQGALAATAIQMARELDDVTNSATSKSMCAKALKEILAELRELAPPKREADRLDELSNRRAKRARKPAA